MHVIAASDLTPPASAANWRGPCAQDPAGWDLDAGTLIQWLEALRECGQCPVLDRCLQLRAEHWPQADPRRPVKNPKSVIWAGVAYSDTGRVLSEESLRRLAAQRRLAPLRRRPPADPVGEDRQQRAS